VIKSLISYQIKQDLQDRLENNFDDLVAELDKVAVD
jgi:hypothetical protein